MRMQPGQPRHLLLWLATAAQALTGRPADTTQELRPYFPHPPVTECYAAESHARVFADGSGASLSSFTAFASVKASSCRKAQPGAYGYNSTAPWYARGCSLLNAVAATAPGPAWSTGAMKERRKFVSEARFAQLRAAAAVRPITPEMRDAERKLSAARRAGARADWGVSLGEDGSVHFGAGLRVYGSEKRGVPQNTVRAVGEATASGTSHLFDDKWHDIAVVRRATSSKTSTLEVWVDGRREALVQGVEGDGFDGGGGALALHDAPARVPVGQLLTGCVRGASIIGKAFDDETLRKAFGADDFALYLRNAAGSRRTQREYPVYYSAHSDPGSREMADLFLGSLLTNSKRVVPRESTLDGPQKTMAQRFGSKIALIKEAMDAQPDDTYAIITEIDVRFFGNASAQIADLVDDALERCGANCDAVFQREDDHSLHRNMGFIVLRVCESVRHLFEAVGLATAAAKGMRGGVFRGPNVPNVRGITPATDQQIVNVALWEPERLLSYDDELVKSKRPCLKTALMPSQEVATRGYLLQVSLRYKNKFGMTLYHVNDYGGIPHPDKARSAKMSELLLVEKGVFKQKTSALRELDKFKGRRERLLAEAGYK
jgi:hypothetical protein